MSKVQPLYMIDKLQDTVKLHYELSIEYFTTIDRQKQQKLAFAIDECNSKIEIYQNALDKCGIDNAIAS